MADETCYFLVQWEDRFMSVIEPKNVVAPKTDVAHYKEGDLIKATYQKRTYDAVISEIHHDRKFLLKQAKLPPKHAFEATKDREKTKEQNDHTPTRPRDKSPVKRSLIQSDAFEEIDQMDFDAKQKPSKQSDQTPTEPHDQLLVQRSLILSDASKEINHMDNRAKQKPSSEKPVDKSVDKSADVSVSDQQTNVSPSLIQSSKKRSIEQRLDFLEREVKELRRAMKKVRRTGESDEPSASSTMVSNKEKGINEILEVVNHLPPATNEKEVNECLKKLCFAIFSKEEMVNCSRTGKKTIRSPGAEARPALDKQKMETLEKAVLTKCPSLHTDVLKKKIDNIIKMTRRDAMKEKL